MTASAVPLDRLFVDATEFDVSVPTPPPLRGLVRGTGYWNGPGQFSRLGARFRHWLDGDGLILRASFTDDRISIATRFVETRRRTEEEAGHPMYRAFGTSFPGDRLKRGIGLESPANVSACVWRGALLACGEQGLPYAVDPDTLETRGLFTFANQLNEITPLSAHPKLDPKTGELFTFGVSFAAANPLLHVFRIAADGTLVWRRRVPLPYPASIHDCAISPSYVVFHVSPYVMDVQAVTAGGRTVMESLTWEPERGSLLLLVDRATGSLVRSLDAGAAYCLHLVNAFEDDGRLVVDLVEYDRPIYDQYEELPDLFGSVGRGVPARLLIEPDAIGVAERRSVDYCRAPDFPSHGADCTAMPYDECWMLGISATGRPGPKFFDELVHVRWPSMDTATYRTPAGQFLGGEPLVAATRRGQMLVICQALDPGASASALLVFDGREPGAGPLASVDLPHYVPPLFHSCWHRGVPL